MSAYTARRRFISDARVTKVQYPGSIAVNLNTVQSGIYCNPDFTVLNYAIPCPFGCANLFVPPIVCVDIYDGGLSNTNANIIYEGGNSTTESLNILNGVAGNCDGNALNNITYDGGNVGTNSGNVFDGGNSSS